MLTFNQGPSGPFFIQEHFVYSTSRTCDVCSQIIYTKFGYTPDI